MFSFSSYNTQILMEFLDHMVVLFLIFFFFLRNEHGENTHHFLVSDLRGKAFSFSPLNLMLAMYSIYVAFTMLRYVPSIPALLSIFIINGCWILSNASYSSIKMIIWFVAFMFLKWCIIDWLFNHHCIPGINPTWSCGVIKGIVEFCLLIFFEEFCI